MEPKQNRKTDEQNETTDVTSNSNDLKDCKLPSSPNTKKLEGFTGSPLKKSKNNPEPYTKEAHTLYMEVV